MVVRTKSTKLKTAKGRKISSTRWLQRKLNDPYTIMAKNNHYRSRAAYKLQEIDDKFALLQNSYCVIDIGSAPGSWSQVLVERLPKQHRIIAIDIQEMPAIPTVTFIKGDFTKSTIDLQKIISKDELHLILSDMSPHTCGINSIDQLRSSVLTQEVLSFAESFLSHAGNLVMKLLGNNTAIYDKACEIFTTVKYFKPSASYKSSQEVYLICLARRS